MQSFKDYLEQGILVERFANLFIVDRNDREKYVDQVWDILQKSYEKIGGIKGNGFGSKEDMIEKIPFWKLGMDKGTVRAVGMYKDKGGRKSVAVGTDGSPRGKELAADMMKNDLKRSYGEKSKAALGLVMKLYPFDVIEPFLQTPAQVIKLGVKNIIPVSKISKSDLPKDGQKTLEKFPELADYAYIREIGGEKIFKIMLGTPGLQVT